MKDNVIKAVFAFTHRINDDGNYRVSFEFRADTDEVVNVRVVLASISD